MGDRRIAIVSAARFCTPQKNLPSTLRHGDRHIAIATAARDRHCCPRHIAIASAARFCTPETAPLLPLPTRPSHSECRCKISRVSAFQAQQYGNATSVLPTSNAWRASPAARRQVELACCTATRLTDGDVKGVHACSNTYPAC